MSIIFHRTLFVFLIIVAAFSVAVYAIGAVAALACLIILGIVVVMGLIVWSIS